MLSSHYEHMQYRLLDPRSTQTSEADTFGLESAEDVLGYRSSGEVFRKR